MLVVGGFGAVNFMLAPTAELAWLKSEAEGVQLARAEGKPMVIDFGATWCLPCKELEKNVFSHPDVARELRKFTLVKVDLTHELEDESLAVLKQKYDVGALPSVRMATPDGRITGRVDGLIGVPEFLATLAKARSGSLAQR
jgi:thiol:disulfide interchange protein DsbD